MRLPISSSADELQETILCVLPFEVPKQVTDKFRADYPKSTFIYFRVSAHFTHGGAASVPDDLWKQATILVTLFTLPPDIALVENVKLIHFLSAGVDHVLSHPIYKNPKIPLTTSSGIHGPQIAEHVFATVLALTHHVPKLLRWQRERKWGKHTGPDGFGTVHDLVGRTLGILGYGSIGRQVANVGKAMGMKVLAYTASPRTTPESKRDEGYIVPGTGDREGTIPEAWFSGLDKDSRRHFLEQGIDVLLIGVPMTEQTRGFLGKEEFEILSRPRPGTKKGAYIVNIARGGIVDQDALLDALNKGLEDGEGGLAGASLDVTTPEPLSSESPLWDCENCIITPHVSGVGDSYSERSFEIFNINLRRMINGGHLLNLVDRRRGY